METGHPDQLNYQGNFYIVNVGIRLLGTQEAQHDLDDIAVIGKISVHSLRKTVGKVSPILVTRTSRSDSDFGSSNVSLKENKPDGVNPNSNDIDYYVRKNEGKILWFWADCSVTINLH